MQRYLQPSDVGKMFKTYKGHRVTIQYMSVNWMNVPVFVALYDHVAGKTIWTMTGWLMEDKGPEGNFEQTVKDHIIFDE